MQLVRNAEPEHFEYRRRPVDDHPWNTCIYNQLGHDFHIVTHARLLDLREQFLFVRPGCRPVCVICGRREWRWARNVGIQLRRPKLRAASAHHVLVIVQLGCLSRQPIVAIGSVLSVGRRLAATARLALAAALLPVCQSLVCIGF